MLIGLSPPGPCAIPNRSPVLCRAENHCNPGDACTGQLAGGVTCDGTSLQRRGPMGRVRGEAGPALRVSTPAGLSFDSLLPPTH